MLRLITCLLLLVVTVTSRRHVATPCSLCKNLNTWKSSVLSRLSFSSGSSSSSGSRITFCRPTNSRVRKWFASSTTTPSFNHETAGMTNPSLHIGVDNQVVMHISTKPKQRPQNKSSRQQWWPRDRMTTTTGNDDDHWRVLEFRRCVGAGQACYEAVRDKVLTWEFQKNGNGIVSSCSTCEPVEEAHPALIRHEESHCGYQRVHTTRLNDCEISPQGLHSTACAVSIGDCQSMATFRRVGPLWVVNPVRVLYDVVDQRGPSTTYTSSAYGTLRGHWLKGEERVSVALRDDTGDVDVQIVSYSRPNHWITRLTWPMVDKMQRKFFESQVSWLQEVAEEEETKNASERQQFVVQPLVSKPVPMPIQEPILSLPIQ